MEDRMLITPQKMLKEGYIKSGIEGMPIGEDQIQQIGLDVRAKAIQRICHTAILMRTEKHLPTYAEIDTNQDDCWVLEPGAYALECVEECSIPIGFEGKLIHRSTFNRSGCFITGSVYDPGYRGIIAGTMYTHIPLIVQRGTRIAQFQMQTAEVGEKYDGDYQDQESHSKAMEKVNEKEN